MSLFEIINRNSDLQKSKYFSVQNGRLLHYFENRFR